jgi:hypothetical protein
MRKKIGYATSQLPSDGFRLRPLLFDGIEVRTVGRQVLKRVSVAGNSRSHLLSLVKCGVVHDDHGCGRSLREQILDEPCAEHIGVHGGIEEADGEECMSQKGSNRILPATGVPVSAAVAPCSSWGIPMDPRSVEGKSALVEVHDGAMLNVFVPPYPRLELNTMNGVSFGMKQSFF